MIDITTKEVIDVITSLKENVDVYATTTETCLNYQKALDYMLEQLSTVVPERHKYKYICNVAGDLEYTLSTIVYADSREEAYSLGASLIYKEHPNIKRLENDRVFLIK